MNIKLYYFRFLCDGTSDRVDIGQMCTHRLQIKIAIDLIYWIRSAGTENVTLKKLHLSSCKHFCSSYHIS